VTRVVFAFELIFEALIGHIRALIGQIQVKREHETRGLEIPIFQMRSELKSIIRVKERRNQAMKSLIRFSKNQRNFFISSKIFTLFYLLKSYRKPGFCPI
jgi:hypothetical protein